MDGGFNCVSFICSKTDDISEFTSISTLLCQIVSDKCWLITDHVA